MIPGEWLELAAIRVAPHIRRTLLTNDAELNIYLKWENQQITGSFKARGACNKVLSLEGWEQAAGLVAASAGNHGMGLAQAGKLVGAPVIVFVPEQTVSKKIEGMRSLGAEIRIVKGGYEQAEMTAISFARENGQTYISAYNDAQVIAGQGTVSLEIGQDLVPDSSQTWVVPVGGGGLIAGIGATLACYPHRPRLVGVQPAASAFMHSLYFRNTQENVKDLPTLAEGLAGAIEVDSLTIPMVKQSVDDIILVTEEEIGSAVAFAWFKYHEKIEGSAAAALAPVLAGKVRPPAVVVISGGNIQPEVHDELCRKYQTNYEN